MLDSLQLQQLKSATSPQAQTSKVMTPEEAKASFAPTKTNTSPADILNAGKNISDAFHGGLNQIKDSYNQGVNAKNPLDLLKSGVGIAAGAVNTAFSPLAPVAAPVGVIANDISDKISDIPAVQDFAKSKFGENTQQVTEFLNNLNTVVGGVAGVKGGIAEAPKVGDIASKIPEKITGAIDATKNATTGAIDKVKTGVSAVTPESGAIMNRVARLTPTDATKFENLSGMSHGDYLAKSGNMGTPDAIIKNEATKFVNSINTADTELAKLPGVYESAPLKTMANELVARENRVSTPGASSPDLARATELKTKLDNGGLNMSEVNDLKRIYERNVKLDYARQNLPEQTAKANNLDSAVRTWQSKTATDLGFKNLGDINKQTQISKFIIDKLGKQLVGKTGNDAMGLTDWIILAGHSPESVGAFLTKKFFSSKGVQAKIASMLSDNPTIKPVVPNTSITPENINRQVNPSGNLALPAGGSSTIENKVPQTMLGKSTMEAPAQSINSTDATPLSQPLLEKLPQKALPKTTIKPLKSQGLKGNNDGEYLVQPTIDMTGKSPKLKLTSKAKVDETVANLQELGFDPSVIIKKEETGLIPKSTPKVNAETSLMNEAKKYKTAEEFKKNYDGGLILDRQKVNDWIAGGPDSSVPVSELLGPEGKKILKEMGIPDIPVRVQEAGEDTIGHSAQIEWRGGNRLKDARINIEVSSSEEFGVENLAGKESDLLHELAHAKQITLDRLGNKKIQGDISELSAQKHANYLMDRAKSQLTDIWNKAKGIKK